MEVTLPLAQIIPWAVSIMFGVLQWSLNRNIRQVDRDIEQLQTILNITTTRMDGAVMDLKLGLARIEEKYAATQKELGSIDARFRHVEERIQKTTEYYRGQIEHLEKLLIELQSSLQIRLTK